MSFVPQTALDRRKEKRCPWVQVVSFGSSLARKLTPPSASNIRLRQTSYDFHSFKADRDDPAQEVKRVTWVAHGFHGVAVGIVGDAAGGVFLYRLPLHDPFNRGLAVDHVVVGFLGDVGDRDVAVVDDRAAVLGLALAAEPHLGDVEEGLWIRNVGKA